VEALMWATLAARGGAPEAEDERAAIAAGLTAGQRQEAERRAEAFLADRLPVE